MVMPICKFFTYIRFGRYDPPQKKEKERYFNKTEVHDFTKKFLDSMTGPENLSANMR